MTKAVFVIGIPRSGTTLVARWIGACFDHALIEDPRYRPEIPVSEWPEPAGSFVHKWCHSFQVMHQILARWPQPKFVIVERDFAETVASIVHNRPDSKPQRPFADMGSGRIRIVRAIHWAQMHLAGCENVRRQQPDAITVQYEILPSERERLSSYLGVSLPPLDHYKSRNVR